MHEGCTQEGVNLLKGIVLHNFEYFFSSINQFCSIKSTHLLFGYPCVGLGCGILCNVGGLNGKNVLICVVVKIDVTNHSRFREWL